MVCDSRRMTHRLIVLALIAGLGCGSKKEGQGEPPPAAETKPVEAPKAAPPPTPPPTPPPVVGNPDGVPAAVAVVPDGKLIDAVPKSPGGTWKYAYAGIDPVSFAEKQKVALEAKGWKTAIRPEAFASLTPPTRTVFGSKDGRLVVAQAYSDGSGGTTLNLIEQSIQNLKTEAPADYPADVPFLPFGIPSEKKPGNPRVSLVYNGEVEALREELKTALAAAGWDCMGSDLKLISMCKKSGVEIFISLESLSANRQSLIIGK
jgi:hypothetical protein